MPGCRRSAPHDLQRGAATLAQAGGGHAQLELGEVHDLGRDRDQVIRRSCDRAVFVLDIEVAENTEAQQAPTGVLGGAPSDGVEWPLTRC